jgi:hypothetical protein
VRQANTLFQLMTLLEENRYIFLIVEHGPLLYEDAEEMVEHVVQVLKQTSREVKILLYSPSRTLYCKGNEAGRPGVFSIAAPSRFWR